MRSLRFLVFLVLAACSSSDRPAQPTSKPVSSSAGSAVDLGARCGGTWAVRVPTVGETRCRFADPLDLVFSIEPGASTVALRSSGERVEVELGLDGGACTATFRFQDRFSSLDGTVTLALRDEGTKITGQLRRDCTIQPIAVSGQRRAEPTPPRELLPAWRLREAYAKLLETCELQHDMVATESSRLELTISATGALVALSKDGVAIDLGAACVGQPAYKLAGFLGYPGQETTRTLVLQHRVPDELGVGPLLLGISTSALPRLGLTSASEPKGTVSFTENGEQRPASIRFGGSWALVRADEVLLEVFDSPADRRVDRIKTPVGDVPSTAELGEYLELGLGLDHGEVGAALEGWISPEKDGVFRAGERVALGGNAPSTKIRPRSPCSFAEGDRVTRFAGSDPIYWDDGGQIIGDSVVLCRSSKLFHVRAGAPTRTFKYDRSWRGARGRCEIELNDRLQVVCTDEYGFPATFRAEGDALIWVNGSREPQLHTHGMRLDRASTCEQILDRYWKAFEPSVPYYAFPPERSPELTYKLAGRAREWVAACERAPETARQCMLSASDVLKAGGDHYERGTCEGMEAPLIDWNLDKKPLSVAAERAPTASEAAAIFSRLIGTWGDPDSITYGARFFRRDGKMWMHSGKADYTVTFEGPRTLRVEKPYLSTFRRFAFVDEDSLYLNDDAIRPLRSRDQFKAGFGNRTFIKRDGTCVAFGPSGIMEPARCEFERTKEGNETLVLEVQERGKQGWTTWERIPIVDGMMINPQLHPLESR